MRASSNQREAMRPDEGAIRHELRCCRSTEEGKPAATDPQRLLAYDLVNLAADWDVHSRQPGVHGATQLYLSAPRHDGLCLQVEQDHAGDRTIRYTDRLLRTVETAFDK